LCFHFYLTFIFVSAFGFCFRSERNVGMRTVWIDTETGGLLDTSPTIQIAAIAVDEQLRELAYFERKLLFDLKDADPEALALNSYDLAAWSIEAVDPAMACDDFAIFLAGYKDVKCVSKRTGRPYYVAQIAGHNAAKFDGPRLQRLFKQHNLFLPATFLAWDTLQRAAWYFFEHPGDRPENLQLPTLATYFGVPVGESHDALADARTALAVYKAIRDRESKIL
jgi:hypothetical protein